jgi:FAD/FMN-containing dehydrogenase
MLQNEIVEDFESNLSGQLIQPQDDNYGEARTIWNGMIDKHPALIARCRGVADVIEAVNVAREHELLVSVRGGGHNVAGNAMNHGGLVIDLSSMKGIQVDPEARIARVQGGVTWGDLDRETQVFGLATPGGVVSTTGVAGLTLGGGLGWLRRKYGLTCDNLIAADVVTADGRFIRATEEENTDLLWALRGGGGNFGVVTSFEFRLHEIGPKVFLAAPMYPADLAAGLFPQWRDFMADAPEAVTSQAIFWTIPEVEGFPEDVRGQDVFVCPALYSDDWREGQKVLQPLRELAEPVLDLSGTAPYTEVQKLFDPFFPESELYYYWKSLRLDRLDQEVIDAIAEHAANRPSPKTIIPVWHHGGAMNRVGPEKTAFGDRSAPYLLSIDSTWENPQNTEENVAWTREVWKDMQRFSSGSLYLNFPGFGEEGEDLVKAAFGKNYERLVEIKTKYDPENLFRMNQNIKPHKSQIK